MPRGLPHGGVGWLPLREVDLDAQLQAPASIAEGSFTDVRA